MVLLHFLRLVRFGNLVVIGVTMCIIQAFIGLHDNFKPTISSQEGYSLITTTYCGPQPRILFDITGYWHINLSFILLILSVLFIAAAGNIINDYFDVKADQVNKPKKVVIDKYISKRWAFAWNWILNVLGITLAAYLSWLEDNILIVLIALATVIFLWFYSALYKRKIFVGNIIIAVLVGIVPIYVLIYNLPIQGFSVYYQGTNIEFGTLFIYEVVISISIIAFVINLMREIIKDMADIKGDLYLAAKTVPIALGLRRTKIILSILLIPLVSLISYYTFNIWHYNKLFHHLHQNGQTEQELFEHLSLFIGMGITTITICLISFIILLTSNMRKRYLLAANLLKLAMLFGIISPLFL
jgi:4-hydroxybenzoate polyprenyltransferase